ncbi:MAG: polyamine ABC transporter ATP-binding protein [Spirochaetae bacterium HGW-Spirochaetae-4]|jgi:iron(III) transport system ATP-binding protein|nr:MAG: polyamine ABC transporter ATP-binding protein [Spirochaetae bacterium HGW-Spirochaetae-8]PKL22558.1 MAG: polyamine ABC transporter ATP-binding protein [Spirochaetae bacterium HGW-Spirochaetae-4]
MSQITLKNVTKEFMTRGGHRVVAVDNFNLTIKEGECFSFLGPSGCGKTTTLRMIAGFEDLSEGEIWLGDKPVSIKSKNLYVPPEERGLGMVFQSFAVWPHLNVFENVAFPLRVMKLPKHEIRERVLSALSHTDLLSSERVYPSDLSGGQQQRIALARSIVTNPRVMLLDEPLSNLDPKLRESMRFEIKALQKKFNFTIIFVTHDQSEAMALSDRMLVMDLGKIVQVGAPDELYQNPTNKFVYGFLGLSNFLKVEAVKGNVFPKGGADMPIPFKLPVGVADGDGLLASRPNEIDISMDAEGGYPAKIEKRLYMTFCIEYHIKIGKQSIRIHTSHANVFPEGSDCFIHFKNPRWYAKESQEIELERTERQVL